MDDTVNIMRGCQIKIQEAQVGSVTTHKSQSKIFDKILPTTSHMTLSSVPSMTLRSYERVYARLVLFFLKVRVCYLLDFSSLLLFPVMGLTNRGESGRELAL